MPTFPAHRKFWIVRTLALSAFIVCLIGFIAVIASSPFPLQVAGLVGGLVERIKQHPVATAIISLSAVGLSWAGIALSIATQELRAGRKP